MMRNGDRSGGIEPVKGSSVNHVSDNNVGKVQSGTSNVSSAEVKSVKGKGYTGGRSQEELDELAGDPSHGFRIEAQGIKEREIGLDLESDGRLGRIVRDPTPDKGAEFIDTTTGIKWDVLSIPQKKP